METRRLLCTFLILIIGACGCEDESPQQTDADVQEKVEMPLHEAASEGDVERVRLLIASGAEVDAKNKTGETALHKAADAGARCQSGRTALGLARAAGHSDVVRLLETAGKTGSQGK